jgi:hypothetical protein
MFIRLNAHVDSASQLLERVEQMRRDSLTPVQGAEPDYGARLKDATKRRLFGCRANQVTANASANDGESFGEQLKRAMQKHQNSQQRHRENAEAEKARYHKPQRRPHTKSD